MAPSRSRGAIGGLSETLHDDDPTTGTGNAVLFHHDSAEAFWDAIVRAMQLFADASPGGANSCSARWRATFRGPAPRNATRQCIKLALRGAF